MEILFGMGLVLFLEGMAWMAWRVWHKATAPTSQKPRTLAQHRNQALSDHLEATTPVVSRLRLQRRTPRGAHRRILENRDEIIE